MLNRSKVVAVLLASLAIVPVLAGGRPACCVKAPKASAASRGCCAAMVHAQATAPKGCCKTPVAPKPATRANDGVPIALSIPPMALGAPVSAPVALPEAVSLRLAQRAHHANAPDESPPDLLSRIHVLLI